MRGGTALGIGRSLYNPISRQTLAPFSTFSNNGGGRGRGSGRGGPTAAAPSLFPYLAESFPDQPESDSQSDPLSPLPSAGHGRGKPSPSFASPPPPPSFGSGIQPGISAGRGQGHVQPRRESREGEDTGLPKKPVFFRREDAEENQPAGLMTALGGGIGRGRPASDPAARIVEESKNIRAPRKPKLSREEAVRQAMGILQQGGGEGPEDGGGGGRGGEMEKEIGGGERSRPETSHRGFILETMRMGRSLLRELDRRL